ncbi:glycosyltransferase [Rhodococcoides yunnanense]|uniref:glycosyltransferase n=1 Tax=Rhodococcoides yunnanense TaxID=278209 RepID=UPI001FE8AAEF|nr:glycosyltransferase [Rhodococcus yunnanensis]
MRTVHNVQPHEPGRALENRLLERADRAVDLYIKLNTTTEIPRPKKSVTILHGHYKDRTTFQVDTRRRRGTILYFGLIREYKGVPGLINAFRDLCDEDARLKIVGKPASEEMGSQVSELAGADDRISTQLSFVADKQLAREISGAELVVLPYREMHNSGSLLLALSLGTPVLVPESTSNEEIRKEVGGDWILTYSGTLTKNHLSNALQSVRSVGRTAEPDLAARDWDNVKEKHYLAYIAARGKRQAF